MDNKLQSASISSKEIGEHLQTLMVEFELLPHHKILNGLLDKIEPLHFRLLADLKSDDETLKRKHFLILVVERVLELAKSNNWGLCKNHDFIYLFNGAYWQLLDQDELKNFLGEAAKKMGVDRFDAYYFQFKEDLYKQFMTMAHLPKPKRSSKKVVINLKNGTFVIDENGFSLRDFDRSDFLIYQLPFDYDPTAKASKFQKHLDKVLPDKESQILLAEYLGYVFMPQETLKLEKALLLYGSGANGKSVLFDIMAALFGKDNITSFSLRSLTNENGYYRAILANKLVNYTSEIGGTLETAVFKQLVSGEPVEARLPYGVPFVMEQYGKLIFNCNDLPKDVEHTDAYFRRFIIIPFIVRIPDDEQDKELAKKIIHDELSGVFNWVLDGLKRLLAQRNFSKCEAALNQLETYRRESDNVQMFLDEESLEKSIEAPKFLKEIYAQYSQYTRVSGYKACSSHTFSQRLRSLGFIFERRSKGYVVFIKNKVD